MPALRQANDRQKGTRESGVLQVHAKEIDLDELERIGTSALVHNRVPADLSADPAINRFIFAATENWQPLIDRLRQLEADVKWIAGDAMRSFDFDVVVGQCYPDNVAHCKERAKLIYDRYGVEPHDFKLREHCGLPPLPDNT